MNTLFQKLAIWSLVFTLFISCKRDYSNQNGIETTPAPTFNNNDFWKEHGIEPDNSGMRDISSVALSQEMIPGWNIGNSLDATGGETSWGNPLISQRLIDSVKAAGFNSVRIPVAWSKFSNASEYTIDAAWMLRVEEVVNYALNNNMYVVLNIHWDGGWMQPTYSQQEYVNDRLEKMWRQIATHFRNYDDRLLFAGTNEVMVNGNYGPPTLEYAKVQNSFNQTFITTARSTGGRNAYRQLVVQGFNTNIDYTLSSFVIPTDVISNKMMVEVHYYDPFNFTLESGSNITQWGKDATDPSKTEAWSHESHVDDQFQDMKTEFIDKGYGVLVGEYGAISRPSLGSQHAEFRRYYLEYVTRAMVSKGLVPMYWDNGNTGSSGDPMGLFYRSNGAKAYPTMIKAIVDASKK